MGFESTLPGQSNSFHRVCRHCRRFKVTRPRGLCWGCYYKPGVKDLYPSTSKYARRGYGHGYRVNAPLPSEPTTAPPNTPEKIEVLRDRAMRGEELFHPQDARYAGDPTPLDFIMRQRNAEADQDAEAPTDGPTG